MALARVLASDAAYLLLDEPATALPGDARERIVAGALALWKRDGRGAAVVSHEPFIERLCDARLRLDASGGVEAARENAAHG
jgi:ABC-type lipoprotein export system ATPase subunit